MKTIAALFFTCALAVQAQAPALAVTQTGASSTMSDAPFHIVVTVAAGEAAASPRMTITCNQAIIAATTAAPGRVYVLGRQPTKFAFEPATGTPPLPLSFDVWAAAAIKCAAAERF